MITQLEIKAMNF
jgi:hypothetical protein